MIKNIYEPARTLSGGIDELIFSIPLIALVLIAFIFISMRIKRDKYEKITIAVFVCYTAELVLLRLVPTGFTQALWEFPIFGLWTLPMWSAPLPFNFEPVLIGYITSPEEYSLPLFFKGIAELTENILLFIPFGVLFPLVFNTRSLRITVLSGFLFSVITEIIQPLAGRYSTIDDIICNTLGVLIGILVYRTIKNKFPALTDRFTVKENTGKDI